MIVLDTSVLIDSFTAGQRLAPSLRRVIEEGERLLAPAIVLYEWLRGPRIPQEIALQEAIVPKDLAIPYGYEEALVSASLYRSVRRPRGARDRYCHCGMCHHARRGSLDREPEGF